MDMSSGSVRSRAAEAQAPSMDPSMTRVVAAAVFDNSIVFLHDSASQKYGLERARCAGASGRGVTIVWICDSGTAERPDVGFGGCFRVNIVE